VTKDIRLSIGFLDHPKTIKIQRTLGSDGVLSLIRLWAFAAQYKPDGILTGMDADDIEIASKWNGMQGALLTALLTHKWVDERIDESGSKTYLLHDWEDHQGYVCHSENRSKQAKRAAETRWKNKEKCSPNADSIEGAMLKDAKRNAPSPNPYPSPNPKKKTTKVDFVLPEDISPEVWDAFVEHRKILKKPLTDHAKKLLIQKLEKIGQDKNAVLNQAIEKGWQSVFPLKDDNPLFQNQQPTQQENPVDKLKRQMKERGEI